MEVEKIQDGPLKNNEVLRFLEASKTSYRSVESILSKKKESSFQQRTLLEIAAEAEVIPKENLLVKSERNELAKTSNEVSLESLEDVENAKKIKEEEEQEALRLAKAGQEEQDRISLETKEKEILEKGISQGRASIQEETKEKLEGAMLALENARQSVLDLNASHFIGLRDEISSKILYLASERAGSQISELSEPFTKKIELLIETIGQQTQTPTIYLSTKDIEVIQEYVEIKEESSGFIFKSKPELLRGDIHIEIGSISISDTAELRSNLKIKATEDVSAKKEAEVGEDLPSSSIPLADNEENN